MPAQVALVEKARSRSDRGYSRARRPPFLGRLDAPLHPVRVGRQAGVAAERAKKGVWAQARERSELGQGHVAL